MYGLTIVAQLRVAALLKLKKDCTVATQPNYGRRYEKGQK